ncbi:MAG TPA: isopentenyl-diphosphate Delta-isomerase [Longimicrobiaceae bacterium]|nr:isopentenyl-diphosphate Delta-isomerase [Longimicrobiaceae bacterium]
MEEKVVLVDDRDNVVGSAPKLQAHREGSLHRAISVFLFSPAGEMLLQRRAAGKYHSAGLWTNACCSHPRLGEKPHQAAVRRLEEEMGLACPLSHVFSFIYRAALDGGLIEHELDHVFVGVVEADPDPDPAEVDAWRWIDLGALERELALAPETFTAWFPIALRQVLARRGIE